MQFAKGRVRKLSYRETQLLIQTIVCIGTDSDTLTPFTLSTSFQTTWANEIGLNMFTFLSSSFLSAKVMMPSLLTQTLLLAQEEDAERGYNLSWFLVMLCVLIGLSITLTPTKREEKVERAKD